jgi:cytoskeletal protein RodZ
MSRRSLLLGILAWMAVVVLTSGVTWAVINAAGQQVLSSSDVPAVQSQAEISQPTEATAPRPSKRPTPRPTRTTPAAPSDDYPSAPRTMAQTPPAPTSTSGSSPSTPRPPARSAGPSSSPVEQRTWQGGAGSVTVRCSGGRAALQSASPSDGYRIEVGSRGPGEVEVTFRGEARQVQVKAVCVSGSPRFGTETDAAEASDD